MLRALLTAFATARATTQVRRFAEHTGYGIIAIGAVIIAMVFISMALFFYLNQTMSSALASAIVAVGATVLAALVAVYAWWQDRDREDDDIFDHLGLSSLGISSNKDVKAIAHQANVQIRRVGPIKVSLAALAAGLLLGRKL